MGAKFERAPHRTKRDILSIERPWSFDQAYWIDAGLLNNAYALAKLDQIDTSQIPLGLLRNHVIGDALELTDIEFDREEYLTGWHPGVRVGPYSMRGSDSQLLSHERLCLPVQGDVDEFGRTVVPLPSVARADIGVSAETLSRSPATSEAVQVTSFRRVVMFTGMAVNGVEIDTAEDPLSADTSQDEFLASNLPSAMATEDLKEPSGAVPVLVYDLGAVPTAEAPPVFSRRDLFLDEITLTEFNDRRFAGTLTKGDYVVGYAEIGAPFGVMVYLPAVDADHGAISYHTAPQNKIVFNRDVTEPQTQTLAGNNIRGFALDRFPLLDKTVIDPLTGLMTLDTQSATLTVDGAPWTRVQDLSAAAAGDLVFELNPATGIVTFGSAGVGGIGGARPSGSIVITYTAVPLIYVETSWSSETFFDMQRDIDPKLAASRGSFLALDTRSLIAGKIILTTTEEYRTDANGLRLHGPLSAVVRGGDDLADLTARVVTAGNNTIGVPNVAVRFHANNSITSFTQLVAVTDQDGYARTRIFGAGQFHSYILSVEKYQPQDSAAQYLQPLPALLTPYVPPYGTHFGGPNVLLVPEMLDPADTDLYVLIHSIPAAGASQTDYDGAPIDATQTVTPYNGVMRKDGILVAWTEGLGGGQALVHPLSISPEPAQGFTSIRFPYAIPRGDLIVSYKLVTTRRSDISASLVDAPDVISNTLIFEYTLDDSYKGRWRLPIAIEEEADGLTVPIAMVFDDTSGRIGSATFITPNPLEVLGARPLGGGADLVSVTPGDAIEVYGSGFPPSAELKPAVFIMKVVNQEIVSVRNITSLTTPVINAIQIPSLPEPPSASYPGSYWIAVGGYDPFLEGVAPTAVELTFLEP